MSQCGTSTESSGNISWSMVEKGWTRYMALGEQVRGPPINSNSSGTQTRAWKELKKPAKNQAKIRVQRALPKNPSQVLFGDISRKGRLVNLPPKICPQK